MDFRAELAIATAVTITATIIDLPRALVGFAFGVISHYLPYGTIIIAVGSVAIAAVGEFVSPGRLPVSMLRCAIGRIDGEHSSNAEL